MSNYLNTFQEIKTELFDADFSSEEKTTQNSKKEKHYLVPQSLWDRIKSQFEENIKLFNKLLK
jgi:hypothetical protein